MHEFFSKLNLAKRAQLLWREGELISDRSDGQHRVTLYKVFSMYVEVTCDPDFTTIEEIEPVTSPYQLRKYSLHADHALVEQ